jgi:hypothetical protein
MSDVPLPSDPHTQIVLCADDTTIYSSSKSPALLCKYIERYPECPCCLVPWLEGYINAMKSKAILISKKLVSLLMPLPLMVFASERLVDYHGQQIFWSHVD